MPKILMDLNDRRPAWTPPAWVASEVEAALPAGWRLEILETEADGSGDGVTTTSPELLEGIRDAEVYLGYGVPPGLLSEGRALRWIHSGAAGVGSALTPEMKKSPILFTNSKGIHGPPMADTCLAMILYFARGLDLAMKGKRMGRWATEPFYSQDHPLVEISSSVVGIFGFGGIGRQVGQRVLALGGRVLAFGRNPRPSSERERFRVAEELDTNHPNLVPLHGQEGFRRLLEESDFLVLTAPETPETRGVLDAEALRRMKSTAVLINLSRGSLVVEGDLLEALRTGRLRGAGLDVFAQEPLPEGHPLWDLDNVILTPHVSGVTRNFWRRQVDLILENLRRYLAGDPLLNLVDKEEGY